MSKRLHKGGVAAVLVTLLLTLSPTVASAEPYVERVFGSSWECNWTRVTSYGGDGVCISLPHGTWGLLLDDFNHRGGSFSIENPDATVTQ